MWDNHQWYTVLLLFLPFLSICWRLHEPAKYGGYSGAQYLNPDVTYQQFLCGTIVHFSATLVTGILNLSFFIKFSFSNTSVNVNERNLFFVTAFTFITQLLRIGFTFSQVMPTNTTLQFFARNFTYFNDAFALSGSLSLLVLR
uniref:Serpentine receptor class gamma n=1 Tax=Panagrolaimus davidi TaxID=227884 RepID=A0A914PLN7_9BILA